LGFFAFSRSPRTAASISAGAPTAVPARTLTAVLLESLLELLASLIDLLLDFGLFDFSVVVRVEVLEDAVERLTTA